MHHTFVSMGQQSLKSGDQVVLLVEGGRSYEIEQIDVASHTGIISARVVTTDGTKMVVHIAGGAVTGLQITRSG